MNIGDQVQLNSGGPWMTVTAVNVDATLATVAWFDSAGAGAALVSGPASAIFPIAALTPKVPPAPPSEPPAPGASSPTS